MLSMTCHAWDRRISLGQTSLVLQVCWPTNLASQALAEVRAGSTSSALLDDTGATGFWRPVTL